MNRGLHELASSIKRKVAALFAPVEPKPQRSGLFRRTLLVTAIGLFAGAAALGICAAGKALVFKVEHTGDWSDWQRV
mgnify:CR=1 FL=1